MHNPMQVEEDKFYSQFVSQRLANPHSAYKHKQTSNLQ